VILFTNHLKGKFLSEDQNLAVASIKLFVSALFILFAYLTPKNNKGTDCGPNYAS